MEVDSPLALILSFLTGGAVIAAIVNGIFNRKKLSAEAANLLTQAASNVVKTLESQVDRLLLENQKLQEDFDRETAARSVRDAALARALRRHAQFDLFLVNHARRSGITPESIESIYDEYMSILSKPELSQESEKN